MSGHMSVSLTGYQKDLPSVPSELNRRENSASILYPLVALDINEDTGPVNCSLQKLGNVTLPVAIANTGLERPGIQKHRQNNSWLRFTTV